MKLQVTNSRSRTSINPLVAKRRYLGRVHEMREIPLLYSNSFLPRLKPGLAENEGQCRSRVGAGYPVMMCYANCESSGIEVRPFHHRRVFRRCREWGMVLPITATLNPARRF